MGTDWLGRKTSGSSGGGGTDWLGRPTSGNLQQEASGLLGGHSGGISGFIENAGGDIAGTLLGIPSAAVHVGGQVAYDFGHTNRSLAQAWKDPHGLLGGVLRPIVESERQSWGPLFGYAHGGGDIHKFEHQLYQHPLGPALDALTVLSLGGSGALKGVQFADKAGKVAEGGKLSEAARGERSITFQPEGSKGITEPLRPGKTLQGRLIQNRLDRLGETRPNLPVIGASRKVSAITDKRAFNRATTSRIPVREFQATVKGLTSQERFALHIAAAGTPLPERLSYFEDRLATAPSKALEAYVRRLKSLDPKILSAPSERMVRAVSQARDLEAAGGKTLVEIGKLTPATRAERKFLEQRLVGGAKYREAKTIGYEQARPTYQDAKQEYDAALHEYATSHHGAAPTLEATPGVAPLPIAPSTVPTFSVKLPRLFYDSIQEQGAMEGHTFEHVSQTSQFVNVRMDEPAFRHLERVASRLPQTSTVRSTVRRLAMQKKVMEGAVERSTQRLAWKVDRESGVWHVGDYGVVPGDADYEVYRNSELLGHYRDLPSAKRAVERDAAQRRVEAFNGNGRAKTAANGGDPFMAAIDQSEASPPLGTAPPIEAPLPVPPERLQRAIEDLRTSRVRPGAKRPITTESGFYGGPKVEDLRQAERARLSGATDTGISPEFGPAFRTPHVVETERGTAGLFSTPKGPLGKARAPAALKQNRGLRMATAQLATNPEIFGTDYLATTRYAHQLDLQKNVLDRVASELDPHLPGGKRPDEYYYRPQGPSQLPRDVREQDAIAQDAASQGVVQASADDVVFKHLPPGETTSIGVLNERGVRRVPARFATRYKSQFGGVSSFERHFLDRPLDVWRAFVLRARPAWLVNNLLGNSVLYALRYAGRGGAAALLMAIKHEHGDEPLIQIGKMIQVDKRMRSLGPVLEEVAPGLGQSSFFNTQGAVRHAGVYSKDVSASAFQEAVAKGGVTMKVARKSIGKVANSITWLNTHTENMMREAAFLAEADRAGVIRNIQRQAKEFEGVNLSLKEALRRMDTKTAEDLTNRALRALGDFNSLSPFERRFIRKVIPFYSWYRVITTVIAHSVIDDPLRWRLLQVMAQSAADDPSAAVQFPAPSWLRGSIPLGPESGGTQSVLSTQSTNPFGTIVQEGQVAKGLVSGSPQFGTSSPLGFLNPFLSAGLAGVGVDPSFGGAYQGPGASHGFAARAGGQFALSLPQVQLGQHVSGQSQSTLYPQQSSLDYLLNYLGYPVKRVNVREAEKRAKAGE